MKILLGITAILSLSSPVYSALSLLQIYPGISPQEIETIVQRQGLANTVSIIFLFLSVLVAIFLLKHIKELTVANITQSKTHQESIAVMVKSHQELTQKLVEDNRVFLSERMNSMDKATELAHNVVECFGPAARKSQ